MEGWNGGIMEYWESKTDDGLILNSDPCQLYKIRSHSAKPSIPTLMKVDFVKTNFRILISDFMSRTIERE
jgi:hypothetical protein